jgi:hypothetical protein
VLEEQSSIGVSGVVGRHLLFILQLWILRLGYLNAVWVITGTITQMEISHLIGGGSPIERKPRKGQKNSQMVVRFLFTQRVTDQ